MGKLEERLRHWGAKLDEVVSKVDEVDSEAKVELRKRIDEFRAKHQAAQAKLAEYKAAGSEKWDDFKAGIESSWSELEDAFRELKQKPKR
jgi:phage shock protein A